MINKITIHPKVSMKKSTYPFLSKYAKTISPNISVSVSGTRIRNSRFSEEENRKIQILRERMLSRMASRPKGTINVTKDWMIDDSELSYIEVPERKQMFKLNINTQS